MKKYPKDWVERHPMPQEVFSASAPGSVHFPGFIVAVTTNPAPLDKMADILVTVFRMMSKEVTLVSDKPSQLRDGTPAREIGIRWAPEGVSRMWLGVATKKGDLLVLVGAASASEKIGEDLKAIPYSIEFQPDKDKPATVPADVQVFLDRHGSDVLSHDVAKVIGHWSDRAYLTGFIISNGATFPMTDTSIIKENGEWKWYGNQRDPIP